MKVALFLNKKTKDNQPDYRGKIKDDKDNHINDISLWFKTSSKGEKYLAGTITAPYKKQENATPAPAPLVNEDDLPF